MHITDLYKITGHSCINQDRCSSYNYFAVAPTSASENFEILCCKTGNVFPPF